VLSRCTLCLCACLPVCVSACLSQIALVACAVVLLLYGWVLENWRWTEHHLMYEVALLGSFVMNIEAIILSRIRFVDKSQCYVGSYPEVVFTINWVRTHARTHACTPQPLDRSLVLTRCCAVLLMWPRAVCCHRHW
jgi:hypothetical protein